MDIQSKEYMAIPRKVAVFCERMNTPSRVCTVNHIPPPFACSNALAETSFGFDACELM
jgi:hypothetical protein